MILPHPETDLTTNVLVVAADIIKIIEDFQKHKKSLLLDSVMQSFLKKEVKRTPDLFISSVMFLYMCGLIEHNAYKIKRGALYRFLDEKGALDSIKNTYEEMITKKVELEKKSQAITLIDTYQDTLSKLDIEIFATKQRISSGLRDEEAKIDDLRKLFKEILQNAISVDEDHSNAYFSIDITQGRKDTFPFNIEIEIPKSDSLGHSRLKIVAYDLMVFLYNIRNERKFSDFLIHDGVFHGVSTKTTIDTINYIHREYLENIEKKQFQYIVTFNEDEIIMPEGKEEQDKRFDFNFRESIVAEFQDIKEKTIFRRFFG